MPIAQIFQSGGSQAVRLPKEFYFSSNEVEIFQRGDEIVLREHKASAAEIFEILTSFPDDFMTGGRVDLPPQEREPL
ncbi:MAG: antitoxin [Candidatus Electronema sp. V4]|uniref:antitoxin n=1 Tax=Candidatus Electronema sp. V4 TaxID=3454756 RepID=UPI00405589B5